MQLPRPTSQSKDEGFASFLHWNIWWVKNTIDDSKGFSNKTYRMHSKISEFISNNFYEKRLISDKKMINKILLSIKKSKWYFFIRFRP